MRKEIQFDFLISGTNFQVSGVRGIKHGAWGKGHGVRIKDSGLLYERVRLEVGG